MSKETYYSVKRDLLLTSLPQKLFDLPIRTLDISGNHFEEIPPEWYCATLINLTAGQDKITCVEDTKLSTNKQHSLPSSLRTYRRHVSTSSGLRMEAILDPIICEGDTGRGNLMMQQELEAKFKCMVEGKFVGVQGGPQATTNAR